MSSSAQWDLKRAPLHVRKIAVFALHFHPDPVRSQTSTGMIIRKGDDKIIDFIPAESAAFVVPIVCPMNISCPFVSFALE
jgi:hypothetical protein